MFVRRPCCLLALLLACNERRAAEVCEVDSLMPLAPADTPAQQHYNTVLASLQDRFYEGLGQYIDGTLPTYRGTLRVLLAQDFDDRPDRSEPAVGTAYAVIVESTGMLDAPSSMASLPLRELRLALPDHDFKHTVVEDPRSPGILRWGNDAGWVQCEGTVTALVAGPGSIELDDIVCEIDRPGVRTRLELGGTIERLAPADIDRTTLTHLRDAGDVGYLPELHVEPAPDGLLVLATEGVYVGNERGDCHDEIEYRATTHVDPWCLADHGVTELTIRSAERCCCDGGVCDPFADDDCTPL